MRTTHMAVNAKNRRAWLTGIGLALAVLGGCHRPRTYEATVEITRLSALQKDETGAVLTSDVEFEYTECPGTTLEVVRGGKDFSGCALSKLKVGERAKVRLEHHWNPEGHWDYDVLEIAGCARPRDPDDDASYKLVRECSDWTINGTPVGFQCNYAGKKELNKRCPWFRRR